MIELRLFASLREGRGKIIMLDPKEFSNGHEILDHYDISEDQASIYLINGFHSKLTDPIKDEDVVAIFPPVGGG